jgi:predicted ATPase
MGDPPPTLPVLWAVSLFHLIRGNLKECRDHADELVAKGGVTGDPKLLMGGYHMAGVAREFLGDMVESNRLLERSRELHVPADYATYTKMFGVDPGILARAMSSRPMWALGYPDRALARAREAAALAKPRREPLSYSFAMLVLEGILAYRGDAAEAIKVGDENIALCREHGMPQEAEWSRSFKGWALITQGRIQEGLDLLTDSLAVQARIKTRLARSMFLALLAEGLLQAGRVEEGLKAVWEGLYYAEMIAEGGYVAELYRMRGELMRKAGDHPAAESCFHQALEYAIRQKAKSFELRASTGLAALLAERGDDASARAVLAPVCEWFTEGFSTSDWIAARKLLSEIG